MYVEDISLAPGVVDNLAIVKLLGDIRDPKGDASWVRNLQRERLDAEEAVMLSADDDVFTDKVAGDLDSVMICTLVVLQQDTYTLLNVGDQHLFYYPCRFIKTLEQIVEGNVEIDGLSMAVRPCQGHRGSLCRSDDHNMSAKVQFATAVTRCVD